MTYTSAWTISAEQKRRSNDAWHLVGQTRNAAQALYNLAMRVLPTVAPRRLSPGSGRLGLRSIPGLKRCVMRSGDADLSVARTEQLVNSLIGYEAEASGLS